MKTDIRCKLGWHFWGWSYAEYVVGLFGNCRLVAGRAHCMRCNKRLVKGDASPHLTCNP